VSLVSSPAILLRSHDYGDSSKVLKYFTRDLGPVSVMAHGARARAGKGRDAATVFGSGNLVFYFKEGRDLHTLREFTPTRVREGLGRNLVSFAGAAAIVELVSVHSEREANPELFDLVEELFDSLEGVDAARAAVVALSGLWQLVAAFGFAPRLDECVACGRDPGEGVGRLDLNEGGIRCEECSRELDSPRLGPVARRHIGWLLGLAVDDGQAPELDHARAHLSVLSAFLSHHVTGRQLESLEFLAQVLASDEISPESVARRPGSLRDR